MPLLGLGVVVALIDADKALESLQKHARQEER
jgi:hypothetical protein